MKKSLTFMLPYYTPTSTPTSSCIPTHYLTMICLMILPLLLYTAGIIYFTYITGWWRGDPYNTFYTGFIHPTTTHTHTYTHTYTYIHPQPHGNDMNVDMDVNHDNTVNKISNEYIDTIDAGYEYMKHSQLIVVGLIRDNAAYLQSTFQHLNHTLQHFHPSYHIIVIENDSTDDTPLLLQEYHMKDQRVIPISLRYDWLRAGQSGAFSEERFIKMSHIRNTYLRYIREHSDELVSHENDTYMMIVDMDMEGGWSIDGVAHTFGLMHQAKQKKHNSMNNGAEGADIHPINNSVSSSAVMNDDISSDNVYDVICANGIYNDGRHFDTLAFRDETYNDTRYDAVQRWDAHQLYPRHKNQVVSVHSCFGGLAIYDINTVIHSDCQYESDDCEHVTFHRCLRESGYNHIFINPNMILYYGVIWDTLFFAQYPIVTTVTFMLPTILLIFTALDAYNNLLGGVWSKWMYHRYSSPLLRSCRWLSSTVKR